MIRVFLVEDDEQVRDALSQLLAGLGEVSVVDFAESEGPAVTWLVSNRDGWDLSIIDLMLSEGSGLRVLSSCRIRANHQDDCPEQPRHQEVCAPLPGPRRRRGLRQGLGLAGSPCLLPGDSTLAIGSVWVAATICQRGARGASGPACSTGLGSTDCAT